MDEQKLARRYRVSIEGKRRSVRTENDQPPMRGVAEAVEPVMLENMRVALTAQSMKGPG